MMAYDPSENLCLGRSSIVHAPEPYNKCLTLKNGTGLFVHCQITHPYLSFIKTTVANDLAIKTRDSTDSSHHRKTRPNCLLLGNDKGLSRVEYKRTMDG